MNPHNYLAVEINDCGYTKYGYQTPRLMKNIAAGVVGLFAAATLYLTCPPLKSNTSACNPVPDKTAQTEAGAILLLLAGAAAAGATKIGLNENNYTLAKASGNFFSTKFGQATFDVCHIGSKENNLEAYRDFMDSPMGAYGFADDNKISAVEQTHAKGYERANAQIRARDHALGI